jgi:acetyl-CoA carboxylase carboxyl transferase subunit alpha
MLLAVPIFGAVIGLGGSGGALGIGVADRVAILQYAWYSVISPEACSAILFKGNDQAPQLAEALKLTSKDLKHLGVVDHIIPEPLGAAHRDPNATAHANEQYIANTLPDLKRCKIENVLERRYERFRNLGVVTEQTARRQARAVG